MVKKTVTFFWAKTNEQAIRLSREHQGYLWVPFEKAYTKLTYNNAKELIQHVDNFLKTQQQ